MAKFKSILKKVSVKTASRKRKCYHSKKHEIVKGDLVLEIDSGLKGTSGYCSKCAAEMLESAKKSILEFQESLLTSPKL